MQKKEFLIYKFRTMRLHNSSDQITQAVTVDGNDKRITKIGGILRKYSIDELPQLVNVIKGDMNLVGPRPVLPEQILAMRNEDYKRFDVRPGITGLAQVRGRRNLGWRQQLRLDKFYVDKSTALLDVWIILQTVLVLFQTNNIYGGNKKNWRNYIEDPAIQGVGVEKNSNN